MRAKILQVKVKPNSSHSELIELEDGSYQAKIKSPPVDGKANKELISLLAKHLAIAKSKITIKTGSTGKLKLIQID